MTDSGAARGKINIGWILKQASLIAGRNAAVLIPLMLILALPTIVAGGAFLATNFATIRASFTPGHASALGGLVFVWSALSLFGMLSYLVFVGGATHGALADLGGKRASLRECLGAGFRLFPRMLGLMVLIVLMAIAAMIALALIAGILVFILRPMQVVGAMIGSILAIVGFGALMFFYVRLLLAWSAVFAVVVAEKVKVVDSFRRSAALTRGNRWRILGYFGVLWVFATAGQIPLRAIQFGPGQAPAALAVGVSVAALISMLIFLAYYLIMVTGAAALYFELRRVREGGGVDDLAAVFE